MRTKRGTTTSSSSRVAPARWIRTLALAFVASAFGGRTVLLASADAVGYPTRPTHATRKLLGGGAREVIDVVVDTAEDFGETVSEVIQPIASVVNEGAIRPAVTETVSFAEAAYQAYYDWTEDAYHTV